VQLMSDKSKAATRLGRTFGAVALVALIVAAVAASAAQAAPRWKVNGSFLGSGTTKSFTGSGGGGTILLPTLGLSVFCQSNKSVGKIEGTAAGVAGTAREVVMTFTNCIDKTAAGAYASACEVLQEGSPKGTIRTNPMKGILSWRAGGAGPAINYSPETGRNLAPTVELWGGEECAVAGLISPIEGDLKGWLTPTTGEATAVTTSFSTSTGSVLKWVGSTLSVTTTESKALTSGEAFGVAEG
jgi:hypothetical protein